MALRSFLRGWRDRRRVLKQLDRLVEGIEQQTVLLARLADHFAPILPRDTDVATTGPTFSRDHEQAEILGFIDRYVAAKGTEPTEDEIVEFLETQRESRTH